MTTYVSPNFPTKKALRSAIERGDDVTVFQARLGSVPRDGVVYLSGPHYPRPHTWYAQGTMKDGKLVKIR